MTYTVGQKVYVENGSGNGYIVATVHKITTKGNVTVQFSSGAESKYSPSGREIGGDKWWTMQLDQMPFDERTQWIERQKQLGRARVAIQAVYRTETALQLGGKDDMVAEIARLQGLLDQARAMVEAL